MKQTSELMNERAEKDILYSKTVKAGKRVYYIDVKRDRRDALYLSITESKRVKEGNAEERPVFEKHKIFLYREDMIKFMSALGAATDFALDHARGGSGNNFGGHSDGGWAKPEDYFSAAEREERLMDVMDGENDEALDLDNGHSKIKFDIDF